MQISFPFLPPTPAALTMAGERGNPPAQKCFMAASAGKIDSMETWDRLSGGISPDECVDADGVGP